MTNILGFGSGSGSGWSPQQIIKFTALGFWGCRFAILLTKSTLKAPTCHIGAVCVLKVSQTSVSASVATPC